MKTNYAGINYAAGQAVNMDKETGIRYGVIHSNKISSEAFEDIVNNGTDLDFESYQDEIKDRIKSALESALSDCLSDEAIADIVESAQDEMGNHIGDNYESTGDCTRYLYERDGYKIQVASDGDMFVLLSPFVTCAQFCCPCAPGACYLASPLETPVEANRCYCLGPEWFDAEFNPMPYEPVKLALK